MYILIFLLIPFCWFLVLVLYFICFLIIFYIFLLKYFLLLYFFSLIFTDFSVIISLHVGGGFHIADHNLFVLLMRFKRQMINRDVIDHFTALLEAVSQWWRIITSMFSLRLLKTTENTSCKKKRDKWSSSWINEYSFLSLRKYSKAEKLLKPTSLEVHRLQRKNRKGSLTCWRPPQPNFLFIVSLNKRNPKELFDTIKCEVCCFHSKRNGMEGVRANVLQQLHLFSLAFILNVWLCLHPEIV